MTRLDIIVLIHGWNSTPETWDRVKQRLEDWGFTVVVPDLSRFGILEKRSERLEDAIRNHIRPYWDTPIHLIGHSKGGLNARQIATEHAMMLNGLNIKSVTTLGTPHLGAVLASSVAPIPRMVGVGLPELSITSCVIFSAEHKDNPNVLYLSWSGTRDALVPFTSSKWGWHLGFVDADHGGLAKSMEIIYWTVYFLDRTPSDSPLSEDCQRLRKEVQEKRGDKSSPFNTMTGSVKVLGGAALHTSPRFLELASSNGADGRLVRRVIACAAWISLLLAAGGMALVAEGLKIVQREAGFALQMLLCGFCVPGLLFWIVFKVIHRQRKRKQRPKTNDLENLSRIQSIQVDPSDSIRQSGK